MATSGEPQSCSPTNRLTNERTNQHQPTNQPTNQPIERRYLGPDYDPALAAKLYAVDFYPEGYCAQEPFKGPWCAEFDSKVKRQGLIKSYCITQAAFEIILFFYGTTDVMHQPARLTCLSPLKHPCQRLALTHVLVAQALHPKQKPGTPPAVMLPQVGAHARTVD